jgi:hypothetical protein
MVGGWVLGFGGGSLALEKKGVRWRDVEAEMRLHFRQGSAGALVGTGGGITADKWRQWVSAAAGAKLFVYYSGSLLLVKTINIFKVYPSHIVPY